jgi:hypothetical protein
MATGQTRHSDAVAEAAEFLNQLCLAAVGGRGCGITVVSPMPVRLCVFSEV